MNWSEKYRPNTIEDLYLSYDSKTKIIKSRYCDRLIIVNTMLNALDTLLGLVPQY